MGWTPGVETTHQTFYNQALNTLFTYGTRARLFGETGHTELLQDFPSMHGMHSVVCDPAADFVDSN
jgi:hypothetical protein